MTINTAKTVDMLSVLNSITASTPDLIYVFDLNYRFTYANAALLTMWGKSWDDAIGRSLLENGYEPWHAEMHEREIDQVAATKKSIRGEVSFPHAVLGKRIYDYIFVPVLNDQGEVSAVAGTTRDITEIKRTEEALRRSERQHAFLLDLNDLLRAYIDPVEIQYQAACLVGKFLNADRAGYAEDAGDGETVIVTNDYYKQEVGSVRGRFQYDAYGPELLKAMREGRPLLRNDIAADPTLSATEKAAHASLQVAATLNVPLLRSGELIALFFLHCAQPHVWTEEEIHLVQNVAERTWDAVVRARVESALRRSEENLEKKVKERTTELGNSNQELKRSNKNLEEFAYAASHDLKEPIRKIHFFANRLKESLHGRLLAAEQSYFERMELAARRMNTLIDDLLMYSEMGQILTVKEDVDLKDLIDQVCSDLDLEIELKQASIQTEGLFTLHGYRRQLQQLLYNLISNSLKYHRSGTSPVITVNGSRIKGSELSVKFPDVESSTQEFYQLTVADNGIGFNQDDAEKIFNVFTRLHGNAEYKGTGLGLAIVRKVIENHGGYIWAESAAGEGSVFHMIIPAEE